VEPLIYVLADEDAQTRNAAVQTLIKIEDLSSFESELRIPGKDPGSMLPRSDGLFMEPSPYGATADGCNKAGLTGISGNLICTPARQGYLMNNRKFTGDRFNLDVRSGGKGPRATRSRTLLQSFEALFEETFSPLADDLKGGVQAGSNILVLHPFCGVENDFRTDHINIR
jgi:hypothetical protein